MDRNIQIEIRIVSSSTISRGAVKPEFRIEQSTVLTATVVERTVQSLCIVRGVTANDKEANMSEYDWRRHN